MVTKLSQKSVLHSSRHHLSDKQSGIALIYVLLIFLLITAVASEIVTNLWLHTEKNTHYLERVQAKHYAMGAEQFVAMLLEQDFQQDKQNERMADSFNEDWNVRTVDYDVEQGKIELQVIDEQGLFNLNALAQPPGQEGKSREQSGPDYLAMFENLLQSQSMDPELAKKVRQWVSQAQQKGVPESAADAVYLSLDPPRRVAQMPMVSVTELLLVDGFSQPNVEKLLSYITVIPVTAKMNINTAPSEVIRSINNNITEGDVLLINQSREYTGLATMDELNRQVALAGKAGMFPENVVGFFSQYFSVQIKATYRDSTFYLKTLLYRNNEGHVQVIGREVGPSHYWDWDNTSGEP
ncbi:type II secretion system minor pseudopilin GspK [Endozoicomonas ascidiicola]|uniref:type II secretion system minor pseudopilin GspK n=1 Tax=Endozoicomonas ascidiicola TaxID=1698521 RepID=UPI000831FD60|nr:type II secretion system minor pseudopilin GspK [Endozoicomonas ascidiicola]